MMKVLYISHGAKLYGAPKSLLEFVARISAKGVEPIVIIPEKGDLQSELNKIKTPNRIIPYSLCVYRDHYGPIRYIKYIWTNIKAVIEIMKLIRQEQIDIVHTNTLAVNVGAVAAFFSRVPHIWHIREYVKEDFNYKMLNSMINKKLLQKSRCCIAVSKGIKKKYEREYGINIVCLYDGMESKLYQHPVREDYNKKEVEEVLLAGALSEGKGQWDAIHAVEILVNRGIAIHLNIVGNGTAAFVEELKKYVRSRRLTKYITFRPFTRRLQELRIRSDVVLVCSRMEAFGRVTAEAMMAGKIVIGSNAGGTLELIGKNEERGYLYQYGHPEELADRIEYVLSNKEEVVEKEKRAQKYIMEVTDIENYVGKMKRIYTKILKRNKSRN